MDKQQVLEAIKKARENSGKRKFKQSFDLIINLKDINLKKAEEQVELFVVLHYDKGKKTKVCALVGPELLEQAKEACDFAISVDDFEKYQDKKLLKKLAREYDYFIAQATIMPKVATVFGKVLGPRNKMPNPKAGCIVPPNANLKVLVAKLQKQVRVVAKSSPVIYCVVGNEETKDEEIADNVLTIYSSLIHALPKENLNIKNVHLKLTMGKNVKISEKENEKGEVKKKIGKKEEILPEEKTEQKEELQKKEIKAVKKEIPKKEKLPKSKK